MKLRTLSAFLLSAASLGACPNRTPPPPPIAPLSPDEPPAPEPIVGEPMTPTPGGHSEGESESALPPDACEAIGGVCGAASCAERGASEVEGTCYLQGEPQTNLSCCDS